MLARSLATAAASAALFSPAPAQTWTETGDAGSLVTTAQVPLGSGPLALINGTLADREDVYAIDITTPAAFSASTCGLAGFDTMLTLFDARGFGVAFNDDACIGVQSSLGPISGAAGRYYLAITGFTNFARTCANVPIAPSGGPLDHWSGGPSGSAYGIALTGCSFPATTWTEPIDAGENTVTAQTPCGNGPLTGIIGNNGNNDTDLYCIRIADTATFSASLCPSGAGFDTQLFLFDANGIGVVFNDDDCGALSQITNALVTSTGLYYLGITRYNRDPQSAGGLIFNNSPFTGQNPPLGPGAAQPLTSWTGAVTPGGAYTIALTGCAFAAEAGFVSYGTGAPSVFGTPSLITGCLPRIGESVPLSLNNVDPTMMGGALIYSFGRASIPFLHGTILINPSLILSSVTLPALPLGTTLLSNVPVPLMNSLCGVRIDFQAILIVDVTMSFPHGAAFTSGLEWRFGI
jgi:hypothetical protein